MTMKRNAECSLSERAIAFSVDALLSGTGKSKTARTDQEYEPGFEAHDCGNSNEEEYHTKSDSVFPFQEEKKNTIQVELQGADLWSQFYRLGNEMIITKSGRRIFPALKVKVKGLEPKSHYIMWADILPVDNLRSQWVVAGAGEESAVRPSIYVHPDSPALGRQWQSQVVTFDKLKLTNNKNSVSKGQVILHSMHKYLPRIHVQKIAFPDCDPEQQVDVSESVTFTFPETEFITVTAYQNQQITRLKIASNPFAKGFREVLRAGKKVSVSVSDRQKLVESANVFPGTSTDSRLTNLPSTHGIPYNGSMDIALNHRSAFFPASPPLYRLGTSPFHCSSHDNVRTTYNHFPFSPYYDIRLMTPAASAFDGYHPNTETLVPKTADLGTLSYQDSCLFRSESQAVGTTGLVFGWRPGRDESKPTARVAPCIMHDTHSHIYSQMSSVASHQKGT